jgi:hypothetical protein
MGRRESGDPDGTPEQPSSAGTDSGAEQASSADRGREGRSADDVPAKTMTREKYGDYVRSQGEPIPDHERDDDRASGWESGEDRDEWDSDGEVAWDRAEPCSHEEYADQMRAEFGNEADIRPDEDASAADVSARAGIWPLEDLPERQDADDTGDARDQPGVDGPGYAAADRDAAVPEEPPAADIDRWHALYKDYLRENPAGWDQVVNVARDMPDRSPGDTSDLPLSGPELVTMEPRESRAAAFRQEFYQPEVIDGIHDTIEQNAGNVAALFERPPTGSHVELPATVPQMEAQSLYALNATDLTMAGFVVGVMAFELGRWGHNKWESLRGT